MSESESPIVVITNVFDYKGRQVNRAECVTCGKCALIPTLELGTPDQDAHLLRGNMCAAAILSAAKTLQPPTL